MVSGVLPDGKFYVLLSGFFNFILKRREGDCMTVFRIEKTKDFKDDGKRTDSITADCRSSPVSGLRTVEDIRPDGKTGDK